MNFFKLFSRQPKKIHDYLIVNNISADEFKRALEELRQKYSEETAWAKITALYDCKYITKEE